MLQITWFPCFCCLADNQPLLLKMILKVILLVEHRWNFLFPEWKLLLISGSSICNMKITVISLRIILIFGPLTLIFTFFRIIRKKSIKIHKKNQNISCKNSKKKIKNQKSPSQPPHPIFGFWKGTLHLFIYRVSQKIT